MSSSGVQMIGVRIPNWALIFFDDHTDSPTDNMRTVPGYQIIEPMPGGESQVIGVGLRLVWQRNGRKIGGSQGMDFWHDLKHRKRRDTLQTPLCGVRVTVGNFL